MLERAVRLSERRVMRRRLGRDELAPVRPESAAAAIARASQLPRPSAAVATPGCPRHAAARLARLLQHVHRFVGDEREAGVSGEAGAGRQVDGAIRWSGRRRPQPWCGAPHPRHGAP